MKRQSLFMILMLVTISCLGQVKFGVQGGVIRSKVAMKDTNSFIMAVHGDAKPRLGFKAGVFAEIPISGPLYFAPSLNYVRKGGNFKARFFDLQITTNYVTYHLELPLPVLIKNGNSGGFYGGAAPTLSLGLGGKRKYYSISDAKEEQRSELKIRFDNKTWLESGMKDYHLKQLELGFQVFAGYELPAKIRLQLEYRGDFSNLSTTPETSTFKNHYWGLTVGCLL